MLVCVAGISCRTDCLKSSSTGRDNNVLVSACHCSFYQILCSIRILTVQSCSTWLLEISRSQLYMPPAALWGWTDSVCPAQCHRSGPPSSSCLCPSWTFAAALRCHLIPAHLSMCPGFCASSCVSVLPSRFLFLTISTLILVYIIGSSCLWSCMSARGKNWTPPGLIIPLHAMATELGLTVLSVEDWRCVAWGEEKQLEGEEKQLEGGGQIL